MLSAVSRVKTNTTRDIRSFNIFVCSGNLLVSEVSEGPPPPVPAVSQVLVLRPLRALVRSSDQLQLPQAVCLPSRPLRADSLRVSGHNKLDSERSHQLSEGLHLLEHLRPRARLVSSVQPLLPEPSDPVRPLLVSGQLLLG